MEYKYFRTQESPCRSCDYIANDKSEDPCDKCPDIEAWQRRVVRIEFVRGSSSSISHYEEKREKKKRKRGR